MPHAHRVSAEFSEFTYFARLGALTSDSRKSCRICLQRSVFGIASFEVEAPRGFGALQRAQFVAAFDCPVFESGQQRAADPAKPGIRRNVIERDFAGIGDAAYRQDIVVLGGDKQRVVRPDPGFEYFWRLVAQPPFQNRRVVSVIGDAQFRDRPPHDLAGGCSVFRNCIANFHPDIIHQASSAGNTDIDGETAEALKVWPMYRIREVDGHDDEIADTLADLHRLTFFDGATIPEFDWGHWWLAFHETIPVAFAGLVPSTFASNAGYFCRVGVLRKHCGHALQLRMMRALESRARHNGWRCIVSDTTDNLTSANNFIRAGYRLYQPPYPWGWPNTLYWRKPIR